MSMIINFFTVSNDLTQKVERGEISIIQLVKYVQKTYKIESYAVNEQVNKNIPIQLRQPRELNYYPTFGIFEKLYELTFDIKKELPLAGHQPFTAEEVEVLLDEYVGYSGGFLTFKNINRIYDNLKNLSFNDFFEISLGNSNVKNSAAYQLIKSELGFTERDILEELPILKEFYSEYLDYIKNIIEFEKVQEYGLFISIN